MVVGSRQHSRAETTDSSWHVAKPLVILVAGEATPTAILRSNLEKQGYRVEEAVDRREALIRIAKLRPDTVLLNWMPPVLSGVDVCRQFRGRFTTRGLPVIMLTPRSENHDAVHGPDAGADDYISMLFDLETLAATIRSLLWRPDAVAERPTLTFHDPTMDLAARRVQRNGRQIHLTPTEFRLLEFLIRHPRRVLERDQILHAVWGTDAIVEERTIDVHIKQLRKAVNRNNEIDLIGTVRFVGYSLETEPV